MKVFKLSALTLLAIYSTLFSIAYADYSHVNCPVDVYFFEPAYGIGYWNGWASDGSKLESGGGGASPWGWEGSFTIVLDQRIATKTYLTCTYHMQAKVGGRQSRKFELSTTICHSHSLCPHKS